MNRGKRAQAAVMEVHLLREGIIESRHHVQAIAADHRGRVLSVAGDAETATFARSSLKPFQALAVASTGTLERFSLTDKDLAIICSSHQGQIHQVRQVFNILWRIDVEPMELGCPIPTGKRSPLEHNCSGKHAGMLAVCRQRNWETAGYLQRSHPIQRFIVDKIGELLGMPAAEFILARDDCGSPTCFMQLSQIATLYAKLASGDNLDMERILRAMTYYPELVSGEGQFDTELMRLTEGEVISKSGAEGVQCLGRVGQGMGIAIKVMDGSKRAKYATAIQLLRQLGWITPTVSDALTDSFMNLSEFKRLEVVGEMALV